MSILALQKFTIYNELSYNPKNQIYNNETHSSKALKRGYGKRNAFDKSEKAREKSTAQCTCRVCRKVYQIFHKNCNKCKTVKCAKLILITK